MKAGTTKRRLTSPQLEKSIVFAEEFDRIDWGRRWSGMGTSAYEYGDHDPRASKLDWLTKSAISVADGKVTFTARPGQQTLPDKNQSWTTGLLTTEGTSEAFLVRSGDFIETRVRLPEKRGAWPALWTWKDGNNEIDVFEYHPDNPDLLELSNQVRPAGTYRRDSSAISPGRWVTVGVLFGTDSNHWYVNGMKVYSDRRGVYGNWSAYLILNLSVSSGKWHPAPDGQESLSCAVDYLRVWR
ncbi:beta-glucanase [Streptomyces sp. NPDC057686]|uniref:glycoside hydrolase family 16 protein n=1 Tax=Streptomyces sp. NPDC057686 TaxID=3346212 RepID=UPI00367F2AD1